LAANPITTKLGIEAINHHLRFRAAMGGWYDLRLTFFAIFFLNSGGMELRYYTSENVLSQVGVRDERRLLPGESG